MRFSALPGVYCIYIDNMLVYIGSSSNVRSRMSAHGIVRMGQVFKDQQWNGMRFDLLEVKVKHTKRWKQLESKLIFRLQPYMNIKGKKTLHLGVDSNAYRHYA